jgi:uncharacterized membrane protein
MGAAYPAPVVAAGISLLDPKFVQVLIATGLLAAILIIGAVVVALFDRWRKRQANETFSTHDQLASFRLLYERGELSREEFERVRRQLMERLKASEVRSEPPLADATGSVPEAPPADGKEPQSPGDASAPPQAPQA